MYLEYLTITFYLMRSIMTSLTLANSTAAAVTYFIVVVYEAQVLVAFVQKPLTKCSRAYVSVVCVFMSVRVCTCGKFQSTCVERSSVKSQLNHDRHPLGSSEPISPLNEIIKLLSPLYCTHTLKVSTIHRRVSLFVLASSVETFESLFPP